MKKLSIGILALVMGTGIAFTQSSFKAQTTTRWGYVQSTNTFVDISGKSEDDRAHPASGTYSCIASTNVCSGDDASTPTEVSDLSNTEAGNFRLNP